MSEHALRHQLWLNHGHRTPAALYGDDGEMQCHACHRDGHPWDYKRAPLVELVPAALREIDTLRAELALRREQMFAFPFCSDHRDKVLRESCYACDVDTLRAQLNTACQSMWAQAEELDTLRAQLAECYRLTGADPDSNEDAMLAPYAVDEVRRLRMDGEKSSELLEKALAQLAEGRAALAAAAADADATMQAALALQAEAHRESQALAVAGARARAIAEVRTLLEQCSGSFVWHVIPQLAAMEAANVTLDTENAQLRQALRVIRKGLSDDADGEFRSARRWLDTRNIYHGDLSGNRVLELVAKHALHGERGEFMPAPVTPEPGICDCPVRYLERPANDPAAHDEGCAALSPLVVPVTPEPPSPEREPGRCQDCGKRDNFRVNHPSGPLCYTCVRERILSEASEARPTTTYSGGDPAKAWPKACREYIGYEGDRCHVCAWAKDEHGEARPTTEDEAKTPTDLLQVESLPALATTRQAIIEVLVKNRVIGAREAVDRLIAAAKAEQENHANTR